MAPKIRVDTRAFEVIFTAEDIKRAGVKVYEKAMISAKSKLDVLTSSWSTSAQFKSSVELVGNKIVATMETTSLPFIYVDKGVEPHDIDPVKGDRLSFLSDYTPRTQPGKFFPGRSSRGGSLKRPFHVDHPGIKARGWSDILEKYVIDFVTRTLNEAEEQMVRFARTRKPRRVWIKGKWVSPKEAI